MKSTLIVALLLGFAAFASADTDIRIQAAEVVGYGIFESRSASRTAGWRRQAPPADAVEGVRFLEFTNEIPAVLGTGFGFQYVINSTPRGGRLKVRNVIRFPGEGLKTPKGRVYEFSEEDREIRIGRRDFYGYAFDEEWEMIPGDWVFEVWHGQSRLIRKTFTVVEPAADS